MDKLSRGMALNENVRIFCARTTELVQEATTRHDLWPTAAAALGRTLSVGCVMGTMLKSRKEKIEIQINGQGELGTMVVDAYCGGAVRGYVENPHVYKEFEDRPEKLNVGGVVGTNGVLRVIKDMGMKQAFTSEIPLQTGEIGDDFAYYYAESEQTPSVVSVGVLVNPDKSIKAAGVLIIQLMPSAKEEDIVAIEKIIEKMKPVSQLIAEMDDPTAIINSLFDDYQEMEVTDLKFKCECNKGRFAIILSKLPIEDLQTFIDEDHGAEVVCKFCGRKYSYGEETLKGYVRAQKENLPTQNHTKFTN